MPARNRITITTRGETLVFSASGPAARAALTLAATGRKASPRNPALDRVETTGADADKLSLALIGLGIEPSAA